MRNTGHKQRRATVTERNENPKQLINWFDDFDGPNHYRFLSNFYVGDTIDMGDGHGACYKTGEHAFAAYKAADGNSWQAIVDASSPGKAKMLGRRIELRKDWEAVKYDVMRAVLAAKFSPDRPEAKMLLDTKNAMLIEGTHWDDKVWGVTMSRTVGRNWLGTLLMAQRAILRSGLDPKTVHRSVLNFSGIQGVQDVHKLKRVK